MVRFFERRGGFVVKIVAQCALCAILFVKNFTRCRSSRRDSTLLRTTPRSIARSAQRFPFPLIQSVTLNGVGVFGPAHDEVLPRIAHNRRVERPILVQRGLEAVDVGKGFHGNWNSKIELKDGFKEEADMGKNLVDQFLSLGW